METLKLLTLTGLIATAPVLALANVGLGDKLGTTEAEIRAALEGQGYQIEEIEFDPFDSPFRPASHPPVDSGSSCVGSLPAPVRPIESGAAAALTGGPEDPEVHGAGGASDQDRSNEAVAVGEGDPSEIEGATLPAAIEALERKMVTQALEKTLFNQTRAAESLGVSYYQLRRILKRLDLP